MKLTVLVDNNTLIDRYFLAEPALSFFIEDDGKKILFDVGYSNAFIQNAYKMGIDLLELDYVVLSHGHLDHTWGLEPLIRLYTEAKLEKRQHKQPIIISHPKLFNSKVLKNIAEIGSLISEAKISKQFELDFNEKPKWITNRLLFLGSIPRDNDFEEQASIGKVVSGDKIEDDFIMDDSALVYKANDGLVVIAGCAHSGICNTIEFAKEVCKEQKVISVIGGFHLQNPEPKQLRKTLDYFKEVSPKVLYPCHCTDFKSKCALSSAVNVEEIGVGFRLEY